VIFLQCTSNLQSMKKAECHGGVKTVDQGTTKNYSSNRRLQFETPGEFFPTAA
jgi:hypothetical protein